MRAFLCAAVVLLAAPALSYGGSVTFADPANGDFRVMRVDDLVVGNRFYRVDFLYGFSEVPENFAPFLDSTGPIGALNSFLDDVPISFPIGMNDPVHYSFTYNVPFGDKIDDPHTDGILYRIYGYTVDLFPPDLDVYSRGSILQYDDGPQPFGNRSDETAWAIFTDRGFAGVPVPSSIAMLVAMLPVPIGAAWWRRRKRAA